MKHIDLKIPKRIAGLKIPKVVRKGPVADFLNSSGGQVLVAEALLLAARAYAQHRVEAQSETAEFLDHPIDKLKSAAVAGKKDAVDIGSHIAHAFSEAVRAFRDALERPMPSRTASVTDADAGEPASPDVEKKSHRSMQELEPAL